jgi:hypothetical protein
MATDEERDMFRLDPIWSDRALSVLRIGSSRRFTFFSTASPNMSDFLT